MASSHPLAAGNDDDWTWDYTESVSSILPWLLRSGYLRRYILLPDRSNRACRDDGGRGRADLGVIRGTRQLNGGQYYWEMVHEDQGSLHSQEIGICTRNRPITDGINSITTESASGLAQNNPLLDTTYDSWIISTWRCAVRDPADIPHLDGPLKIHLFINEVCHGGFTVPNGDKINVIGLYFDGPAGTLSVYVNGKCFGIVFKGLNKVQEPLYPMFASRDLNRVRSQLLSPCCLQLTVRKKYFPSLQHLCRIVIGNSMRRREDLLVLPLPDKMKEDVLQYIPSNSQDERIFIGMSKFPKVIKPPNFHKWSEQK